MKIGCPREIKDNEYRVAIVPAGVFEFTRFGHEVFVEKGAGEGSGIEDSEFVKAGAKIVPSPADVFGNCDMVCKVKEPQPSEWKLIRRGQILFTYFHFAAEREMTEAILETGATAIAYETVEDARGQLPLLIPMSEVAGRMAGHEGAKYLEKPQQGRWILLGGVPGVDRATVVVIGGGIVGAAAARVAAALGANVTIFDVNLDRLRYLDDVMPDNVSTLFSNQYNIAEKVRQADLVIGAVLLVGAKAPVLVPRAYLKDMKKGAVIVDVAIDQGGCIETSRPTTHSNPTYVVDGVVHYCVTNMPGAVGRTSTFALTNATSRYAQVLARKGLKKALGEDPGFMKGLNVHDGKITHRAVAEAFNLEYHDPAKLLGLL